MNAECCISACFLFPVFGNAGENTAFLFLPAVIYGLNLNLLNISVLFPRLIFYFSIFYGQ